MKNVRFSHACILFVFSIFSFAFGQDFLDGDRYGNKTKNLAVLSSIIETPVFTELFAKKQQEIGSFSVKVPDFLGVSHDEGNAILALLGIDVNLAWARMLPSKKEQAKMLHERKLTPGFAAALNNLASEIVASADTVTQDFTVSQDLKDFIQKAVDAKWRLMIRSTGKEDSQQISNAGGNESFANISPTVPDVIKALLGVIASYVKPKSVGQRLDVGDKTAFDAPFIPVLVQRMISEEINGAQENSDIPTGCVVFTKEPNGKVEDVTLIQASPGHNENVVQNGIVDSFLVDKHDTIFSVIKVKPDRLVPAEHEGWFGLERKMNPGTLQKRPSLTTRMTKAVAFVARHIHTVYKEPVDIELVVDRAAKAIYLVQTRPLQQEVHQVQQQPNYIGDLEKYSNTISCSMIYGGNGSVIDITERDQVIIADNLNDALDIFLDPKIGKDKTKAVIVAHGAESTSHAATIFRGAGIAIFCCDFVPQIEELLSVGLSARFLIDVQQEKIVDVSDNNTLVAMPYEDLKANSVIREGFLTYPLPLQVSITNKRTEPSGPWQQNPALMGKSFKELIDILKKGEEPDAIKALHQLMVMARDTLDATNAVSLGIQVDTNVQRLYKAILSCSRGVLNALQYSPCSLQRLFAIKPLEALFFQQTNERIVGAFSVTTIMKEIQEHNEFIERYLKPLKDKGLISDRLEKNSTILAIARKGFMCATTYALGTDWITFLDALLAQEENIKRLEELWGFITDLDMQSTWINLCFAPCGSQVDQFEKLYNDFIQVKASLATCTTMTQTIRSCDISLLEDPKNFDKQFKVLVDTVVNPVCEQTFLDILSDEKTPQLHTLAALAVFSAAVAVYDKSIKAVKGSTQYDNARKVVYVDRMLDTYLSFFETWSSLVTDPSAWDRASRVTRDDYFSMIKSSFSRIKRAYISDTITPEQLDKALKPSREFSCDAAVFDAKTAYERHEPKTFEDFFTLCHQNLEKIKKYLVKKKIDFSCVKKSDLMTLFETQKPKAQRYSFDFTDVAFTSQGVMVGYNIPLNNHAAFVAIQFAKEGLEVTLKMLGESKDHNYRWEFIYMALLLSSEINNIPIISSRINNQMLEVIRKVTSKDQIDVVWQDIIRSLDGSNNSAVAWGKDNLDTFCKQKKQLSSKQKKAMIKLLESNSGNFIYNSPGAMTLLGDGWLKSTIDDIVANKKDLSLLEKMLSNASLCQKIKDSYLPSLLKGVSQNKKLAHILVQKEAIWLEIQKNESEAKAILDTLLAPNGALNQQEIRLLFAHKHIFAFLESQGYLPRVFAGFDTYFANNWDMNLWFESIINSSGLDKKKFLALLVTHECKETLEGILRNNKLLFSHADIVAARKRAQKENKQEITEILKNLEVESSFIRGSMRSILGKCHTFKEYMSSNHRWMKWILASSLGAGVYEVWNNRSLIQGLFQKVPTLLKGVIKK